MSSPIIQRVVAGFCHGIILLWLGCAQEMEDQRRLEPQEHSDFFADHVATRPLPEFVVQADASAINSRPALNSILSPSTPDSPQSEPQNTEDDNIESGVPIEILNRLGARQLLVRGQQRFNISCAPCHDRTGSGNGMVPRRGFWYPPSYHTNDLRHKPLGYIFSVATQGRGKMPAYGDLISVDDRWAIAIYVRALQLSQYVSVDQLTDQDRQELSNVSTPEKHGPSQIR